MSNDILTYLGNANTANIHARGMLASIKLIELLRPLPTEKILEVGFGTGETIIRAASMGRDTNFFGVELSELMYRKAIERIRFCGKTDRIQLTLLETKNKLPYLDHTFDKVYAESIIAIQEGEDFNELLAEIKRVLKPDGEFIFNETIWLETTDKETAKRVNEECKRMFGIIQSNHDYPYLKSWKKLLNEIGFECQLDISLSKIHPTSLLNLVSFTMLLSKMYTSIGKIKAIIKSSMRKERETFKGKMFLLANGNVKLLEGIIIKACNKK